jgi:hypothetical protein
MNEFYEQGDLEKQNGMPVTNFFDREAPNVPKCQMGFINFIVTPLFNVVAELIDVQPLLHNLKCACAPCRCERGRTRPCHTPMPHAHATRPCHTPMPHAHATRPCHTPMPPAYATRPCHPPMPHAYATRPCRGPSVPIASTTWLSTRARVGVCVCRTNLAARQQEEREATLAAQKAAKAL